MASFKNLTYLKKVLVANRGEIACRVMKTAKRLGIQTVAVYSEADANSLHVEMADEAFKIGKAHPQESYLRGEKIIEVATQSSAQAVHPGYGFLSENAEFAKKCSDHGLIFIGPPPSAIKNMGMKSIAKNIMEKAGVPVVPGYHGENQLDGFLLEKAIEIGFPLMIKAVRGGGGKGMRIVYKESDFREALSSARLESLRSFGDDAVILEKYIVNPRHIEVQIFGDTHGNYVHLFERDCSIQRRHQKVIEQAPASSIDSDTRNELGKFAVKAAAAVNYEGAGTVEFIFDTSSDKFYFMEMNTRLQVEHPVTEMVTAVDLVEWQLRVASGEPIPLEQEKITLTGSAIEARIYAENVDNNFLPAAGRIHNLNTPVEGPNLRIETGIRKGDDVSVHYDPMIAKLVVWDQNEKQAFRILEKSLSEFNIVGVENNVEFLRKLCTNSDLIEGNINTGFIDNHKQNLVSQLPPTMILSQVAIGVVLSKKLKAQEAEQCLFADPFGLGDSFRINNLYRDKFKLVCLGQEFIVDITFNDDESYEVRIGDSIFNVRRAGIKQKRGFVFLKCETEHNISVTKLALSGTEVYAFDKISGEHKIELVEDKDWVGENIKKNTGAKQAVSPMPGVIEKIYVKKGDKVKKGDPVAVIIAMKMEYIIRAENDSVVEEVYFEPGKSVGKNNLLVKFSDTD